MTSKATELESELDRLLDAVDAELERGACESARALLAQAIALVGDDHPEVLFSQASIVWQEHGPTAAAVLLERVVELDPAHADGHYALARTAEERGMTELALEHDLHVLRLDARDARVERIGTKSRLDHIERVAAEVLAGLPSPFVERLSHVPVVLEPRPSRDLVQDGFDPRALGLFEGPTDGDTATAAPTRIVLYTHNLLADYLDSEDLDREIEITLLHEIGHYFGLAEEDMERLGLD